MIRGSTSVAGLVAVLTTAFIAGCANTIAGTVTWPGAKLEKVVLTAADFPAGVQYDRIVNTPGQSDSAGGPPAMLSSPAGCSDGLTRVIANSAERGPGSAVEYVAAYNGARLVMTVLSSPLDLDGLAATAQRCERFRAFFDPAGEGIPITTTKLDARHADALAYQQTMQLSGMESSVYFSFQNVGNMSVFGIAFATPNPSIPVKGMLPQTFLDVAGKQAERMQSA
jgi:hypothetical protein